jgi:Tc5 transposase DNA-binding domain
MESNSNASPLPHHDRIQAAIDDLKSQKRANYSKTAKKWKVERTTLAKRFKGETRSIQAYQSEVSRRLSDQQEIALVQQINKLTLRGMPPTSRICRNLAEEIVGGKVGKNWNARFIQRHKKDLTSLYLRNIDNMRKKADYAPLFRLFYDLVST